MVLPYINMYLPQVYMCSPSWTLLPPPSPYHLSGSSQCTSPKHPVSCINFNTREIFFRLFKRLHSFLPAWRLGFLFYYFSLSYDFKIVNHLQTSASYCSPSVCHFKRNTRLDEAQAGIKTAGRNINNLRYADDTTLMAESEEELKSLLMKVKEESKKAGLKNIQKTKIMAFSPITSWQIHGETMETVTDFIFGGSKIYADGDRSHEIKRCLLLRRKAMTNLDSILKSRDITLLTKIHLVKAMVFPIVMYVCESWI